VDEDVIEGEEEGVGCEGEGGGHPGAVEEIHDLRKITEDQDIEKAGHFTEEEGDEGVADGDEDGVGVFEDGDEEDDAEEGVEHFDDKEGEDAGELFEFGDFDEGGDVRVGGSGVDHDVPGGGQNGVGENGFFGGKRFEEKGENNGGED
jgi:hypothetical protein